MPLEILHVGISDEFKLFGNLMVECTVFLPAETVAAVPGDATASSMSLFWRIFAKSRFVTNALHVPPGAYRKKNPTLASITSSTIA